MFDKCLNASAKVACDYATELSFLNRIFNRTPKSTGGAVFIGGKFFSRKKVRLASSAQSHSQIAFR
jgi:hypothetical protein